MFNPRYIISDRVLTQLSEIAEIKSLIAGSRLLPEREIFLRRAAAIKMAHTSTSIEGNRLREYEVIQIARGQKVNAEESQVIEVKNYLSALKEVDRLSESKKAFNVGDVFRIHRAVIDRLVEREKVGVFRRGPVYIVNVLTNGQEEVVYTPPFFNNVPKLITELLDWVEKSVNVHPIIRAAIFHYQFETIHPFTDGNGRTGRLMALLHLYQSGWDFKKILVLEDYYNRNRKAYYLALQTGKNYQKRQEVDLTNWLEYYVVGFLDEARKVKDSILSLSAAKGINATRVRLDKDELQITSSDVVDILKVPKRTAQAKLKRLEDSKILKKNGAGPSTYYEI
jgi:Fic family protein